MNIINIRYFFYILLPIGTLEIEKNSEFVLFIMP